MKWTSGAVAALWLAFCPPVTAQGLSASDGSIRISSNRDATQAVDALLLAEEYDQARRLMAQWQQDHPDHEIRRRYVEGRIAAAQGRYGEAVGIYRAILADRPGIERVRISLAAALYRMGEDDAARFQAEQLVASGVDDRAGGALQSIIKSIDDRRPLQFSGYASVLPSTNVNNGPEKRFVGPTGRFVIPDEDRQQSGIGGLVGGQAILRKSFDKADPDAPALIATLDGSVRHYPSISRTLITGDLSLGVEQSFGRARILPSIIGGFSAEDFRKTREYAGLRFEASTTVAPAWRFFTAPNMRHERIAQNPTGEEDGFFYDAPLQIDRFFGANRFGRLILGYSLASKEADRFSFDELRGGLGGFAEFPFGLTVYAQGTWAQRDYGGDYPGFGEPREDRRLTGIVALTKRDLNLFGFAPRVVYVFERNYSNIVFFDTTRHDVEFRLTKEF